MAQSFQRDGNPAQQSSASDGNHDRIDCRILLSEFQSDRSRSGNYIRM